MFPRQVTPFVLLVAFLLAMPVIAEAQYRSGGRIASGVGLAGAGVMLTLASHRCTLPTGTTATLFSGPTTRLTVDSVSGGRWLWSDCTFRVLFTDLTGGIAPFRLDEDRYRNFLSDPAFRADSHARADQALAVISQPNHLLRWLGVGTATAGVLLATVWSNSYAEPVFDVQAGPRHIRLSKTFGF